jgi:hypothetical protein
VFGIANLDWNFLVSVLASPVGFAQARGEAREALGLGFPQVSPTTCSTQAELASNMYKA